MLWWVAAAPLLIDSPGKQRVSRLKAPSRKTVEAGKRRIRFCALHDSAKFTTPLRQFFNNEPLPPQAAKLRTLARCCTGEAVVRELSAVRPANTHAPRTTQHAYRIFSVLNASTANNTHKM
jgi:hypothetical protein